MSLFSVRLFSRVSVLLVRFGENGSYRASLYPIGLSRDAGAVREWTEEEKPDIPGKDPLLLLVCGQGVICKGAEGAEGVIARVEADAERFAWSRHREESGEFFCFVQRAQVAPLLESLENVPLVDARYVPEPEEAEKAASERAEEVFRKDLSWRGVLSPTPRGTLLCGMLVRRLRLPLLAGTLLLLSGNYIVGGSLGERRGELQQQVAGLEKRRGQQQQLGEQKRKLLTDFARGLPCRYSLLCDRIGAAVPAEVTLLALEVQPLRKEPAEGAPLELSERRVRITGVCLKAEAANELSERLRRESFTQELSLSRLEPDGREGLLHFTITLGL